MICFAWYELPQYAARSIAVFCKMNPSEEVVVVSPRPSIPLNLNKIESNADCKVIWLDKNDTIPIITRLGKIPQVVFQVGWYFNPFNELGCTCKKNGGIVICCGDGCFTGTLKSWFSALKFRYVRSKGIKKKFTGYMVPGKSGRKLLRLWGMPNKFIFEGCYGADPTLFTDGGPLPNRPKRFIYVGRLVDLKNILMVCSAFLKAVKRHPGWKLEICGDGPLKNQIPIHPAIEIKAFVQPEDLPAHYHAARCLVLASHSEPWGLVVHEAALSGCFLLLSNKIGCILDLSSKDNTLLFSSKSERQLIYQMEKIMVMPDSELIHARNVSLQLAKKFSPNVFARNLTNFINNYFL